MNETKPKKGSKYAILKDEDVHTITGSLKQFFREMKTDLIPIDIFRNLPSNIGKLRCLTMSIIHCLIAFIIQKPKKVSK